jgi:hypothetical protein
LNYPGLLVSGDRTDITGQITITAAYDSEFNKFLNLTDGKVNTIGGLVLSGSFEISIRKKIDTPQRSLPAMLILNKGFEIIEDRHFNKVDSSACLCGPIEEATFIEKGYSFQSFFEEFIVPFLYGQLYFDQYKAWPWEEYGHGTIGTLESYRNANDETKTDRCLVFLKRDTRNWNYLKKLLLQKKNIGGHTLCICGSNQIIRKCHHLAWQGIILLKNNIKTKDIT